MQIGGRESLILRYVDPGWKATVDHGMKAAAEQAADLRMLEKYSADCWTLIKNTDTDW